MNGSSEITEILIALSLGTKPIVLNDPLTLGKAVFLKNFEVCKQLSPDMPTLIIKINGDPTIPELLQESLKSKKLIFVDKIKG